MQPPRRYRRAIACGAAVVSLAACCGGSGVDAHRLHVLSNDPLAVASAPGTTPWIPADDSPDHIEANGSAGSGNGIGFGGTSPTLVQVTRHLHGKPAAALRFYAETAIRNGWHISQIRCGVGSDSFSATKQFPGWTAAAVLAAGAVFRRMPAVSLNIETNYHRDDAPSVASTVVGHWLTVDDLASTCVGGSP